MLRAFAAAIFLSAALLFLVQPMAGKFLLPVLGGSPAVWNTCMVFFQGVLLLGYFYAHVLTTRLALRAQVMVHVAFLVVAAGYLVYLNASPSSVLRSLITAEPGVAAGAESPVRWLIATLAVWVGVPFLMVSTTGPLLQRWFSRTTHPAAKDPYFLYAASNGGSLVGLLGYPFALEPLLTRGQQHLWWTVGYMVFVPLTLVAGVLAVRRIADVKGTPTGPSGVGKPVTAISRVGWVVLALIPSSLMLGVTQHISTDVAASPLLWVGPLALYLLSFMWAFSPRLAWSSRVWGVVSSVGIVAVAFAMWVGWKHPVLLIAALHLGTFFSVAMLCHTRLAESRPAPERLTEFYLLMSVGGVIGGAFNAMVAPVVFSSIMEYPLVLAAAWFARPQVGNVLFAPRVAGASRGAGGVAGVVLGVLVGGVLVWMPFHSVGPGVLYRERTFFGVHYVVSDAANTRRMLRHGTTMHGMQIRTDFESPGGVEYPDAAFRERLLFDRASLTREERLRYLHLLPTTYFHPSGPLGDVMREMTASGRFGHVALIGLGGGSILAYARPNSTFAVFEIDPAVIGIARRTEFFSYASDALRDPTFKIESPTRPGDGRVDIAKSGEGTYNLVIIDAFTSDAIPVHLMTREAIRTYLGTLKPNGVIAFHVSSRYFDLPPVLSRVALDLGLVARERLDASVSEEQRREGKERSRWVVLSREEGALGSLDRGHGWESIPVAAGARVWTDDYCNLLGTLHGLGVPQGE